MSYAYDSYLKEHIGNISRGLHWMVDHLDFQKLGIDGFQTGNVILRADEHDRSKYGKEEYDAYDAYFNGGNRSYQVVRDFDYAWLHHIHQNPHHWQYWVLLEDDGGKPKALEMPVTLVLEMIADWWTFSWKTGNLEEIFDWYDTHKNHMILHEKTRKLVEDILYELHKAVIEQEKQTGGTENGISDERGSF